MDYTRPDQVGSRAAFRSPAFFNVDIAVHKRFALPWAETHRIEVRGAAYNAFNSVNFSSTNIELRANNAAFGNIRSTVGPRGGAREMEFALRYEF